MRSTKQWGSTESLGAFLHCSETKELFPYLFKYLVDNIKTKTVIATDKSKAISNTIQPLIPCNVEGANERILVCHSSANNNRTLIKTEDSDVVRIILLVFHKIPGLIEIWIEFGTGIHLNFLPIHQLATSLGPTIYRHSTFSYLHWL